MIELLIENGILLKRFVLPWTPASWGKAPTGWTPGRTCEWVQNRADGLQTEKPNMPREIALEIAQEEHGRYLYNRKMPWPGWVPIIASRDIELSRAYRQYFIDTNPDIDEVDVMSKDARRKAFWPEDGRYVYRGGKMKRVSE